MFDHRDDVVPRRRRLGIVIACASTLAMLAFVASSSTGRPLRADVLLAANGGAILPGSLAAAERCIHKNEVVPWLA